MNLPNKLTILRIIMIPFFVFFLLSGVGGSASKWIALVIFAAASITDTLDGYIARRDNLITDFGKFMDPLADKLLVCSALICFVELDKLPAWMVIIIIAREFIISGFRLVASDNGIVIAASWWGKSKTISQMIMIILLIADIPALSVLNTVLIWVALILTVVSLIDYLVKNKTNAFHAELGRKKHRIKTLSGLGFQTGSVFWFVVFQRFFPEAAERKRRTIWSIFAASCLDFPALMAEMIRSASEAENCAPP